MEFQSYLIKADDYPRIVLFPDKEIQELEGALPKDVPYSRAVSIALNFISLGCIGGAIGVVSFYKNKIKLLIPILFIVYLCRRALNSVRQLDNNRRIAREALQPTSDFLNGLKRMIDVDPKSNDVQSIALFNQMQYYNRLALHHLGFIRQKIGSPPDDPTNPISGEYLSGNRGEFESERREHEEMYFIFRMRAIFCTFVYKQRLLNPDLTEMQFPNLDFPSWITIVPLTNTSPFFGRPIQWKGILMMVKTSEIKDLSLGRCQADKEIIILETLFRSAYNEFSWQDQRILALFDKLVGKPKLDEEYKDQ